MRHFASGRTHVRRIPILLTLIILMPVGGAVSAADSSVSAADFRASLVDVYGRYQGVLARRDACNAALPKAKGLTDQAFEGWYGRHKRLVQELDQKISMMIRAYSKDDKDFSRNFGKFHGSILQQRQEVRDTLLQQDRAELEKMCRDLPLFLKAKESDLEQEFAEELKVIREWNPPARK
jgi:hypothetical protein